MFEFLRKTKDNGILTKNEIARMLRVSPEQLQKFEEAYQCQVLNQPQPSQNLFDQNAKQAKKEKDTETIGEIPYELVDRIVEELLDGTRYYQYKDHMGRFGKYQGEPVEPADLEEILELPEPYRPQLTGHMMCKDIHSDDSSAVVLEMYRRFLQDPKKNKNCYGMFRAGLDTLDLDPLLYAMLGKNRNSMGQWLPVLAEVAGDFFKIPETTLIEVPLPLLQLTRLDYQSLTPTTLAIVDRYCQKIFHLDETKEYFIKTGTFSSKYDFRNAHVWKAKEVRELGEYLLFIHFQSCQMASFLSQPCTYGAGTTKEWVVREFIRDVEGNPYIYKGLVLHTEYRVFVDFDTDKVLGIANYWDPSVMKRRFGYSPDKDNPHNVHDYIIYEMHEPTLVARYKKNKGKVAEEIAKILPNIPLTGQWSIDVMQNGDDFYIIDMALAESSALKECVPKGLLRKEPEDWIPEIGGSYGS